MKLNNLGNETLPSINSLVRIKTEVINNRTFRNTRQPGYDLQGVFPDFQLGIVCGQRGTNYDVIVFRTGSTYNVYTFNMEFLEILSLDITIENNFKEFMKRNSIISFDNTMLSDSENIYPMTQRLSHERLNDMDVEEIKNIYSYQQLTTHLIRALMAIASLEERFKIIKNAASTEDNRDINSPVIARVAKSDANLHKRREKGQSTLKEFTFTDATEYISTSPFTPTYANEFAEPNPEPSDSFIETLVPNRPFKS